MNKFIPKVSNLLLVFAALLLSSCFGAKTTIVEYAVTSGDENLQALSKITESENSTVVDVRGGYGSDILFMSVRQNASPNYVNIFKKENPLSPSLSEVTSGNNYNFEAFFCKKTNSIAYSRFVKGGGSRDIYMSELGGTALKPVAESSGMNEWSPSLSTDGKLLVYQSGNGSDGEIWVKNLSNGEKLLLGKGYAPMISPDGKQIVFARFSSNTESSLWVMNIDGSNATQLSTGKSEHVGCPCWSPDGNQIVYHARDLANNKKTRDIYIVNANGTGLLQVTANDSNDHDPFWSNDGYIYFISDRGAKAGNDQVWRFKAPTL